MNLSSLLRRKSITHILRDAKEELALDGEGKELKRELGVKDLTALGIAAVIGAGIFSTIGNAAFQGGPAVSLLFIFTGVACAFSALCYAEFASTVPVSGSAYTYAYVAFGELIAWIIGWDLLLEYAIGNVVVAQSWSEYFTDFFNKVGSHYGMHNIPTYLITDYRSAYDGFTQASDSLQHGFILNNLSPKLGNAYAAWQNSPHIGNIPIIMNLPALLITFIITCLVYMGIKDTRNVNNVMVAIKLIVVLLVIAIGALYISTDNWSPFIPHGLNGVMKGASAVFFAYIGFDAISTTAEECRDAKRDLPRGIIYSLIICTILYVAVALVLTGMTSYKNLGVGDPLLYIFKLKGITWMTYVVGFSAIVAMASVLLVFQVGQPRIWMSMGRDGLLPKVFSKIHPVYKTPSFSTILTGLLVAVPLFFMKMEELTDLTSIGTLFAFVLVCGGILVMKNNPEMKEGKFKVPYISGRYIVPGLFALALFILFFWFPDVLRDFFNFNDFATKIPMLLFIVIAIIMTIATIIRKLALIPVLGLLSCLYIMTGLGITNWLRFVIWLIVGLVIYFLYSRRHSKLQT